ncbi:hypothetical protein BO94DRAFT_469584 [Aspergillus sclerotioniger CBS 115572]|uniref:Uncharacterized protein n=1 Tax=Aspergillus sclerotioniger CBS 115572 TaxID=1450535 RepID=A0A317WBJ0_9EURO|nr:hypothetical protein BO94DRAFT_469584 [Aspergillus sclerotioniger CBS 115572]PWY83305.1 hypothetical protein BO94DRAFT_469584 [Aspergillus sclerotioniger CBS 115572]
MSSESLPIAPAAFTEAIKELPLPVLYAKVSEIRNSIAHLHRSNQELRTFIAESCESETDKRELEGYIVENEGVAVSMTKRIDLLKAEVESRGQQWIELDEKERGEQNGNSAPSPSQAANGTAEDSEATAQRGSPNPASTENSGDAQAGQDEEGVYL